ncbi:hypothetical protein FOXG_04683 [Fusarium oxysporum f. sp. lycopersici 4287]|uniref:Uncharacterized protein n=2 Tax=Fusarium oxysporum TaxID=5507 RepID=A0A0J9UR32_FUSO4|nr:hypothetical protein FOXG_04683 [Fusarium oxysporum f. sp. lycopersici 4287]KNB01438.1 hypothetical protein FOXG_04683 [Fusarium oxysporum f. sp. lycopersici 4287]
MLFPASQTFLDHLSPAGRHLLSLTAARAPHLSRRFLLSITNMNSRSLRNLIILSTECTRFLPMHQDLIIPEKSLTPQRPMTLPKPGMMLQLAGTLRAGATKVL